MSFEAEEGEIVLVLRFTGVEVYKCTYRSSCDVEVAAKAYSKVVTIAESDLLAHAVDKLKRHNQATSGLAHYAIYFDDGPYYEFICRGFSASMHS
jgi:hypothetical protein